MPINDLKLLLAAVQGVREAGEGYLWKEIVDARETLPKIIKKLFPQLWQQKKLEVEVENKFYKKMWQHQNLRAVSIGEGLSTAEKISKDGFKGSIGPNLVSPTREKAINAYENRYGTRKNKVVFFVPEEAMVDTPNGPKVLEGWKPSVSDYAVVDYDGQPLFDVWKKRQIQLTKALLQRPQQMM
jgi:hypothetical protein